MPWSTRILANGSPATRPGAWCNINQVVLGKLAGIDIGIETVEEAFLAHVLMLGGNTVYEVDRKEIALADKTHDVAALLPAPGKT